MALRAHCRSQDVLFDPDLRGLINLVFALRCLKIFELALSVAD